MTSDYEQGKFEGRVLTALDALTEDVGEIKETVAEQGERITALTTGQAVHKEEHRRIRRQVAKNRRAASNGERGTSRIMTARVWIPAGFVVALMTAVAEIIRTFFF